MNHRPLPLIGVLAALFPLLAAAVATAAPPRLTCTGEKDMLHVHGDFPGQVWCPAPGPRDDVNPRPLSADVPGNGLIGCFSADNQIILALAWEPYQELSQGVIRSLHSDFRVGGLKPGETRKIRGKMYFVKNDVPALLARYRKDFPEQAATAK